MTVLLQWLTEMLLQMEVLLLELHFRNLTVGVLLRQVETEEVLLRLLIHSLLRAGRHRRIPAAGIGVLDEEPVLRMRASRSASFSS